ncbi:MAG: hypothetical protein KatS3mg105_2605 [Gemmatales bacterium]|nr:MAG: hypothetical protein KatS3mg105_2605 [Gemmatales bacterium]
MRPAGRVDVGYADWRKVTKRYLIQVAARNLSLILRKLFGVGTPRSLQGLMYAFRLLYFYIMMFYFSIVMYWRRPRPCWVDVH